MKKLLFAAAALFLFVFCVAGVYAEEQKSVNLDKDLVLYLKFDEGDGKVSKDSSPSKLVAELVEGAE
jgi:hypothetical protein